MDEQTLAMLRKSRETFFRKTRDIVNAWHDGSVVERLEKLAQDDRYAAWVPQFADTAKHYFCSDDWATLLPKIEKAGPHFREPCFTGYSAYLQQLVLDEMELTGSTDSGLLLRIDQGVLHYKSSIAKNSKNPTTMNYFGGVLALRTSHSLEADSYPSFTDAEFRSIATAITYSLPVYKNLFNDIRVSLDQEGCKVYLGSTPQPWEEQKE